MINVPDTYDPYTDVRTVELSFNFGVIAPDAADLAEPTSSTQAPVSDIDQTIDDAETMGGNYATLEPCMYLLDGNHQPYPLTSSQVGWQSAQMTEINKNFSSNPWIQFDFSSPQSSYGFMLIFDNFQPENYPNKVIATAYGETGDVIDTITASPDSYLYVINMPAEQYSSVKFEFTGTNIPNRRIRLCQVIFGINYYYNSENIEKVTVRQSLSPFADALPSSEIVATVDNSAQLYNMVNPTGLYKFLQDGQKMDWAVTINGNKINMGTSFFTKADSKDSGLTAEITFNDRMLVFDDMTYDNGSAGKWTLSEAVSALLAASGTGLTAAYGGNVGNTVIRKDIPVGTTIREALRLCAQAAMCACYINRNNELFFFSPTVGDSVDSWTFDVQQTPAQIKVEKLYNIVNLIVSSEYSGSEYTYTSNNVAEGDFDRKYEVANPLVTEESGQAVANWILSWVSNRTAYEVTTRGNPALDLMDVVQIYDVYGVNGNAYITDLSYNYDGGLDCDAKAYK